MQQIVYQHEATMKKTMILMLAVMMLAAAPAFGAVIYSQNFDSYSPGNRPSGWWFSNGNTGYISNAYSVSSPNSLEILSTGVTASYTTSSQVTGTYSWSVYLDEPTSARVIFLMGGNMGGYSINLELSNSFFRDNGPDAEIRYDLSLALRQWEDIAVAYNYTIGTYDLIVNGEKIWTKGLDGVSSSATSYRFTGGDMGTKYFDDIVLSDQGPQIDTSTIPLWECGFDTGYFVGDWLDHESEYDDLGWTISTSMDSGHMFIVDASTYIRPGLENITPPSSPQCFMFANDDDSYLQIQRPSMPTGDGLMDVGYVQWDFFVAADEQQTYEFTLGGAPSNTPLVQFGFYHNTGVGRVRDWMNPPTYYDENPYTLGQWHTALVMFDCPARTFSLYIDGDTFCADQPMGGYVGDKAEDYYWKSYHDNEMFLDNIKVGINPGSDTEPVPEPEPPTETTLQYKPYGVLQTFPPVTTPGKIRCIYWTDDLNDTWNVAVRFTSAENSDTTWLDVGEAGRTDPRDPSVKRRYYKIEEVNPIPFTAFVGNYVYSKKFVDQTGVNPKGSMGEHYVRIGMYTFSPDNTITDDYWEWSLWVSTDFDPSWSPFPHTTQTVGVGVGGPAYNDDEDKHIGVIPRFYGPATNLTQQVGTWSLSGRRVTINWNDGSWEKWYATWEELGNLYKLEQFDASYIRAGSHYFLTDEAVQNADEDARDVLSPNVGWAFGCSGYDFTYARSFGVEFQKNLIGCSLEYNTAYDEPERIVATASESGYAQYHMTSNNVLRWVSDGGTYWVYGYYTVPESNPGILARRTLGHIAGDSDHDGHIEDMWGHRNPGLQIIDNAGNYRGITVVQYYPSSPPYLPLSVAARYYLDTKGTPASMPSRTAIFAEE